MDYERLASDTFKLTNGDGCYTVSAVVELTGFDQGDGCIRGYVFLQPAIIPFDGLIEDIMRSRGHGAVQSIGSAKAILATPQQTCLMIDYRMNTEQGTDYSEFGLDDDRNGFVDPIERMLEGIVIWASPR